MSTPHDDPTLSDAPQFPESVDPFEVPTLILEAAKRGDLVIFVGAGVSILCGSPLWGEFANGMIDALAAQVGLNYSAVQQLKSIADARRKASVAKEIWSGANGKASLDFSKILHPHDPARPDGQEAYRHLGRIKAVFVTTNYDKWLSETAPPDLPASASASSAPALAPATKPKRRVFHEVQDITVDKLSLPGTVLHLHGSYENPAGMVISLNDYIRHYNNQYIQTFLHQLFARKTVLFVGYSLSDMEVLEYIVRANPTPKEARHYLLFPYQSSESVLVRHLGNYFTNQCGIALLPYNIDQLGYRALCPVLDAWASKIEVRPPHVMALEEDVIDRAFALPSSEPHRKAAVQELLNHPELQTYFFANVKGKEWFADLQQAGFFDPHHNPAPVKAEEDKNLYSIPTWLALQYLVRVAQEAGDDDTIAEAIVGIIRAATFPVDRDPPDNYRSWWYFAECLSALPTARITLELLDCVGRWLKSNFDCSLVGHELASRLLPRLLTSELPEDHQKAGKLLGFLTQIRWVKRGDLEGSRGDPEAVIGSHWLIELMKTSALQLGQRCRQDATHILIERLKKVLIDPEEDKYGYIHRKAIEDHEQNGLHHDVKDTLISGLRDVLVGWCSVAPEQAREAVRELLRSDYSTLQRIALYTLSQHYETLGMVFWDELDARLFKLENFHELYHLLQRGFGKFGVSERKRIKDFTLALKGDWREPEKAAELDAMVHRDWLHPMTGQGDADIDALYAKLVQQIGPMSDHPDFQAYSGRGMWGVGERSPVSIEELLKMTVPEVVRTLEGFKESGTWQAPSESGLGVTLTKAVTQDPDKFAAALNLFLTVRPIYRYALLRGFEENWKTAKEFPWPAVLKFCETLLASEDFWKDFQAAGAKTFESNAASIVRTMLDLLKAAVERDEHTLPDELLGRVEALIVRILERGPDEDASRQSNPISAALSSTRGRAIDVLIVYTLRASRLADRTEKSHSKVWARVQPIFDRELQRAQAGPSHECSTLIGMYLANVDYLSSEWVQANFDNIFSTRNAEAWSDAVHGFTHIGSFHKSIYQALRDRGHFARILDTEFEDHHVHEIALQYIAIGYLLGLDQLNDDAGLITGVVRALKEDDLRQLLWFLWTLRRPDYPDDQRGRVLDFWAALSARIGEDTDTHKRILSRFNLLASFIEILDVRMTALWKQAAPYADADHNSTTLVEELARLSAKYPAAVGDIFLAALTRFVPTYDEKHILACVENLYRAGEKEAANSICAKYEERGMGRFLMEVFRKNRN